MTSPTKHQKDLDRHRRVRGGLLAQFSVFFVVICLAAGCNNAPVGIDHDAIDQRDETAGLAAAKGSGAPIITHVQLETFQKSEVVPNESLDDPQPVPGSNAILRRFDDRIKATLTTHHLPEGVYTFWWHLSHEDGEISILWAGNYVVHNQNGNGHLTTTLREGEENAPGYIFIGHGLQHGAARTVEVQLWVRLHGPPSEDPEALEEQLTRPFGVCTDTRNPTPRPGDYPCWNPQRVVFGQP